MTASKFLLLAATVCFAVVFVVGALANFDIKDLLPLGLACFSGSFLVP